jgi:hypothetical protein
MILKLEHFQKDPVFVIKTQNNSDFHSEGVILCTFFHESSNDGSVVKETSSRSGQ